jgi:hypothetical protein
VIYCYDLDYHMCLWFISNVVKKERKIKICGKNFIQITGFDNDVENLIYWIYNGLKKPLIGLQKKLHKRYIT